MHKEEKDPLDRLSSPLRLFFSLLLVIYVVELLIMFVILPQLFGDAEGVVENIADSTMLALLTAPFIWMRIVRPLRKRAAEDVRILNEELGKKVEQLVAAQEELVRREKLAIIGQLSGSVGHELRNPLGVMSNAVYFLKMVLTDTSETTSEYLEIIEREIGRSQRIISDLLDFARTRPPQATAVTARDLVNDCRGRCDIPENVEFQTDIQDPLPALEVDPLQVGQVLQNLMVNAVQAMPEGGALRIAARTVRRSRFDVRASEEKNIEPGTSNVEADVDFIEISVADTGEGIPPEGMKRLFQPLFTTKPKGLGLGLTVCKNLVEANGGRIGVASRPGEGTTISVLLPVEPSTST